MLLVVVTTELFHLTGIPFTPVNSGKWFSPRHIMVASQSVAVILIANPSNHPFAV